MKSTLLLIAVAGLGLLLSGCDPETHPDPHLVQSAQGQRQAQAPGGHTPPPTGPSK